MHFAFDLKLHVAFQDNHNLVRGMDKVFPSLTWWIGPQIATEAAGDPVGGDLVAEW